MNMAHDPRPRPNSIPWPPLIYGVAVLAGVALSHVWPLAGWQVWPRWLGLLAGIGLMAAGAGFDGAAMLTMQRHRANILPHRAATALVTSGPFALSRNPIYLGNTLMVLGAALVFGMAWLLPMAMAAAATVQVLAIRREEAHLASLFGPAWQDYARLVPRWLGRPAW